MDRSDERVGVYRVSGGSDWMQVWELAVQFVVISGEALIGQFRSDRPIDFEIYHPPSKAGRAQRSFEGVRFYGKPASCRGRSNARSIHCASPIGDRRPHICPCGWMGCA